MEFQLSFQDRTFATQIVHGVFVCIDLSAAVHPVGSPLLPAHPALRLDPQPPTQGARATLRHRQAGKLEHHMHCPKGN